MIIPMSSGYPLMRAGEALTGEICFWLERNRREERSCEALVDDIEALRREILLFYDGEYASRVGRAERRLKKLRLLLLKRRFPELFRERSAARDPDSSGSAERDIPDSETKAVYRKLARLCHPDLALNPEEKKRRERFMAWANDAYAKGDAGRLKVLLGRAERRSLLTGAPGLEKLAAAQAEHLLLRQVRAELNKELGRIKESAICRLRDRVARGRDQGLDVLGAMARGVQGLIADCVTRLRSPEPAPFIQG